MRTRSMPWFMGLCLSLVACTVTVEKMGAGSDDPKAEPGTSEGPAEAPADPSAPSTPSDPSDPGAPAPAADAGVPPLADAGADAAAPPKHQIPVPTFGRLQASSKAGDVCVFTVDGMIKGTSTFLDVSLVTGTYTVACKRADGVVASQTAVISQNQTTTVVFDFPANGTLVAVAIDGVCAFYVNGSSKGTTSTLKLSLPPSTYLVECKPAGAATKSRTVTIKSGETAMAMFQL